ncbi:site-specific integrase [Geothrix sp. SG200]|uniref:tyrosine-type recombinase/integrase n=1 Tax=Geothrix sp. SG200 TaxID=2922865 RepID=UPI001FADF197|nr:site-specific integrase [Geothrix sp. SG200]
MAQSGYKNGLKKTPKGFWAFKIRVGRQTKEGTFPTTQLQTARKLLERVRDDLLRQQEGLEVELTVSEAMDYWLDSSYARAKHLDRANYAFDRARPVLGSVQVRRLTQATIIAFKRTLLESDDPDRRPLAPTTVNIVLRYLAVAINWAVKNKKIAENPLKQMPYEPVPEDNRPFLVRDDLIPFLMKVDALGNAHQQVAIRAMLLMGLRESEALRLRWDGFTGDWAFYAPARAKNGKAQPIPVQAEVLRAVRALPQKSEWVLPGRAGSLHLKGYTRKVVEEAGVEIGKPGLTPHRLRASCATIHAARGANAFQIRDLLRHERIATSQKYVNKVPCNLQVVVQTTFDGITEMFTRVVPITPQAMPGGVGQIDPSDDPTGEPNR